MAACFSCDQVAQFIAGLSLTNAEHHCQEVVRKLDEAMMQEDRSNQELVSARSQLEDAQRVQDVQRASCQALAHGMGVALLRRNAAWAALQTAEGQEPRVCR